MHEVDQRGRKKKTWQTRPARRYFQFSARRLISVVVSAQILFHSYTNTHQKPNKHQHKNTRKETTTPRGWGGQISNLWSLTANVKRHVIVPVVVVDGLCAQGALPCYLITTLMIESTLIGQYERYPHRINPFLNFPTMQKPKLRPKGDTPRKRNTTGYPNSNREEEKIGNLRLITKTEPCPRWEEWMITRRRKKIQKRFWWQNQWGKWKRRRNGQKGFSFLSLVSLSCFSLWFFFSFSQCFPDCYAREMNTAGQLRRE